MIKCLILHFVSSCMSLLCSPATDGHWLLVNWCFIHKFISYCSISRGAFRFKCNKNYTNVPLPVVWCPAKTLWNPLCPWCSGHVGVWASKAGVRRLVASAQMVVGKLACSTTPTATKLLRKVPLTSTSLNWAMLCVDSYITLQPDFTQWEYLIFLTMKRRMRDRTKNNAWEQWGKMETYCWTLHKQQSSL